MIQIMNTISRFSRAVFPVALLVVASLNLTAADKPSYKLPPLNPDKKAGSIPGKFVWGDLFTTDVQGTATFYSEVFGWNAETFGEGDSQYVLLKNDERPVAGIAHNPVADIAAEAVKARWVGYISVEDIEATTERVKAAGGRVLVPPRLIPDRGTISIVVDSDYIVLGLIESTYGDPADHTPKIGEWIWVQLVSLHPEASLPFYKDVFGYDEYEETRTPIEGDYLLASGGFARAGLTPATNENIKRGGWIGFIHCENAAATAAKAESLGAKIIVPATASGETEMVSAIVDPFGGIVGLYSIQSN